VKKYVNEALAIFPEKIELHLAEGNVRYRMGNHIGAVKSYHKALKYADNDTLRSQIWGQIGDVFHAYGESSGILLDGASIEGDSLPLEDDQREHKVHVVYPRG
jgi:tetratricopeptide (TPR) repeat protein